MLLFLSVMIFVGLQQTVDNWRQISPALGMPMALPYLALPAGFSLMWLFTLEQLLAGLSGRKRRSC